MTSRKVHANTQKSYIYITQIGTDDWIKDKRKAVI